MSARWDHLNAAQQLFEVRCQIGPHAHTPKDGQIYALDHRGNSLALCEGLAGCGSPKRPSALWGNLAAQVPEAVGGRAHGQIRCRGGRGAQVAEVIYGSLIGLLVTWLMSNVWPIARTGQDTNQNPRLPLQK